MSDDKEKFIIESISSDMVAFLFEKIDSSGIDKSKLGKCLNAALNIYTKSIIKFMEFIGSEVDGLYPYANYFVKSFKEKMIELNDEIREKLLENKEHNSH